MSYIRHEDRKGKIVDCCTCEHGEVYPPFPPADFRVCKHPRAVDHHHGERSAGDIVRAPRGACSPFGELYEPIGFKKKALRQGKAKVQRSLGQTSNGVTTNDDA